MNVRERAPSRPDVAPAALVARYESLFEIGRGGMGTIEVALERAPEQKSSYSRVVALKRMHPHARDRRHVEMFLREARLAAWLVHPHVVHAFAFGEIDGELFLAMEYVEGETLASIVRVARESAASGLPPVVVAAILADACEGLHAAHELRDPESSAPLNVIHRDVSPHNVMVSYEGHVKLLDFGVAKMDTVAPLTRTGEVKGKTAYMSPEQAMGDPLDRRSDLFAVGSVLFECLAGRKMWGGGTDLDVLRKLALEAPPRLEEAVPHVPKELADLYARLVERDPRARPATALDVANELRAIAAHHGPRSAWSGEAIAGLMATLFATDAARRRNLLNEAIRRAAPSTGVETLRKSLAGPTALDGLALPLVKRPSAAPADAPPMVPSTPSELPGAHAPRLTGIVLSVIAGIAIALSIAYFGTRRAASSPLPATTPPTAATAATPSPAALTPAAPIVPPPTPAMASSPPAASTVPPHPPSPPSRHPRPRSSGSSHVDVDPNPL